MAAAIRLRSTEHADLDFVDALERAPENAPFIGRWTRDEHADAIARRDREHWIIERADAVGRPPLGYLIAYDLAARGHGVYVKRVVVADKGRGVGRAALAVFVRHAFDDLDADAVWLTVFADNLRAQRAYFAAGFDERAVTAEERAALQAAVGGFSATSLVLRCARRPGAG